MKRLTMLILAFLLCFTGLFGAAAQWAVYAAEVSEETPESESETELMPVLLDTDKVSTDEILLYSSACVVMDVNSGAILYYKNKLDRHYPASTTKIMTTLLALERTGLDENVTFSENAVNSITWDSSNMELMAGNELTMEQALYGIMLRSANEAANGVAEYVSGSMEAFAKDMTKKAIDLGCRRTNFTNPSGLHDDEHYTTAKDLAIIASAAAKNEAFRTITGTTFYTVENINYKIKEPESETNSDGETTGETTETTEPEPEPVPLYNHHKMVNNEYPYEGVYGGKTGYTGEARNTLVTYARRGDMDLVCVILDCPGGKNYIYMDTEKALDYSFDNYDRLMQEYNETQADQSYMPMSILDWYHTEPPLPFEDMLYPYLKQAHKIYSEYMFNRKAQEALDNAINEKSVKDFIEYSRMRDYKPLIIAGIILVIAAILLAFLLHRLIRIIKRKRSWMRYKKLRRQRLNEIAAQKSNSTAAAADTDTLSAATDTGTPAAAPDMPTTGGNMPAADTDTLSNTPGMPAAGENTLTAPPDTSPASKDHSDGI